MWRERNKEEGGRGEKVGKCVYNVWRERNCNMRRRGVGRGEKMIPYLEATFGGVGNA